MNIDKDFFITEGWVFKYNFNNEYHFEKGDTWKENEQGAFLIFDSTKMKIIITTTDKGFNMDGPNYSTKYNGKCQNLEQYNLIINLIDLKL